MNEGIGYARDTLVRPTHILEIDKVNLEFQMGRSARTREFLPETLKTYEPLIE